jgi:hypothetical protein
MNKEFKTYLLLITILIFFWLNGSIVDSTLWFHNSYNTPDWVVRNLSIFYLLFNQILAPFLIVYILKPKWNTIIAFATALCWGGLIWDFLYSILTRGVIISDMARWFDLGDFGFVISFVNSEVLIFHIVRFLIGLILLIWLYQRTKNED